MTFRSIRSKKADQLQVLFNDSRAFTSDLGLWEGNTLHSEPICSVQSCCGSGPCILLNES